MASFTTAIRIVLGGLAALAAPALAAEVSVSQPTDVHLFPGRIFTVVNTIAPGQVVIRGECNPSATWCHVELDGEDGWVPADALRPPGADAAAEVPEGVVPGAAPPGAGGGARVEVTVLAEVNVRAGPGADHPVVGRFAGGDTAMRNFCDEAGEWCNVTAEELAGWVAANYLLESAPLRGPSGQTAATAPDAAARPLPDLPPPADDVPAGDWIVVSGVNVRAGPGNEFEVLGTLDPGVVVARGECSELGHWCQVAGPTLRGWVFADFIAPASGVPNPGVPDDFGLPAPASPPQALP